MKRREVLLATAASIVASMLPLPALALAPEYDYGVPIDKIEQVNDAFNMVERYGFDLDEKATLFGLYEDQVPTLADLRAKVLEVTFDWESRDIWARILMLNGIKQKLDEKFGENNLADQLEYLDSPDQTLFMMTMRDELKSPHWMDLYRVARRLGFDIKTVT